MDDPFVVNLSTETNENGQKIKHASITWKKSNFEISVFFSNNCSQEFQFSDARWSLIVHMDGFNNAIFSLRKVDLVTEVHEVSVECSVIKNNQQFATCKQKYIFRSCIPYEIFKFWYKRYLDDYRNLTVKFDMTVFESNNTSSVFTLYKSLLSAGTKKDHKEKSKPMKDANTNISSGDSSCDDRTGEKDDMAALLAEIEALHTNPRFADVTLKLNDVEFPAHKVILSSRSKVFEAMFEHDMKENRQDTVDLVDMDVTTVKDMLRYIYCGKLRQMSPEEALDLYVAADRYDLPGLVLRCLKIILSGLSIDNICEISVVADLHNDQLLLDAVRALLCDNMKEVFMTDKWIIFAKENPELSLNLIHSAVVNK